MNVTPELLAMVATATGLVIGVVRLGIRLGGLETKVNVIWEFQMRRALSEGVALGIVQRNSPIVVSPEAKAWMAGLAEELRGFYARHGRHLSTNELALALEQHFGERIVNEVCIPHGLFAGACLLIAMEVAKEEEKPLA